MGETEGAESVAVDAVADPVGSAWSTLGNLRAFRRPRSASAATMRLWTTSPAGGAARRVLRQLALQRLDALLVIHEARHRQIGFIDFGDRIELEPAYIFLHVRDIGFQARNIGFHARHLGFHAGDIGLDMFDL